MLAEVLEQMPFLTVPAKSTIRNHARKSNSFMDFDNFNIICRMNNLIDLRILESLYIFKLKAQLNESQSTFPIGIVK